MTTCRPRRTSWRGHADAPGEWFGARATPGAGYTQRRARGAGGGAQENGGHHCALGPAPRALSLRLHECCWAPPRLKFMSYNIQGHAAAGRPDFLPKLAEVIAAANPDIVGLQEVH